ncbi:MAG: isopentenyldiphosphate isomerase [Candidatus Saccharimonadales bacterium]
MAHKDDIGAVVDDLDNLIAHKKYADMVQTERRRITCTFIFNTKGDLLIQQRSMNKKVLPGYWGPSVSGGVESHETYMDNAIKEAGEELGLIDLDLTYVGNFAYDYPDHLEFAGLFKATYNGRSEDLVIQESEVGAVRWISIPGLLDWMKSDEHKVVSGMQEQLNAVGIKTPPHETRYKKILDNQGKIQCYHKVPSS